ncbi:MAG: response regulator [Deltaproteobacteria bacterium]|nr:response regulator [Deltaproteobacteria bacterium]
MKKGRILIVDDEIFLVETLKDRLEFVGYEVLTAENGAEALTKLQAPHPVDLILMDCMMPVMDGLQATQLIKGHEKLKKIPVIFLTARARKEDREEAFRAGADDYLAKPFETDDLLKMIEKWIKK